MLKAINIKWDTDGDEEVLQDLPTKMIIPEELEEQYSSDREYALIIQVRLRGDGI